MVDLSNIQLSDALALGSQLRAMGERAGSIERAAQQMVSHLHRMNRLQMKKHLTHRHRLQESPRY